MRLETRMDWCQVPGHSYFNADGGSDDLLRGGRDYTGPVLCLCIGELSLCDRCVCRVFVEWWVAVRADCFCDQEVCENGDLYFVSQWSEQMGRSMMAVFERLEREHMAVQAAADAVAEAELIVNDRRGD